MEVASNIKSIKERQCDYHVFNSPLPGRTQSKFVFADDVTPENGARTSKRLLRHVIRKQQPPVIVVYHHICHATDPLINALSVRTDPEVFVGHLRHFKKNYDLVSSHDLFRPGAAERPLLITFDDDYRSVLQVAEPLLREVSAPSVWFLNPMSLDRQTVPLDNLISLAIEQRGERGVLSLLGLGTQPTRGRSRSEIWNYVATLSPTGIRDCKHILCAHLGRTEADIRAETSLFLSSDELKGLDALNIEVGNHSMSHSFFRNLREDDLAFEIRDSRYALMEESGQPVSLLAIPYGFSNDATDTALNIARASGHLGTFLVQARSNRRRPASDIFYRIDVGNVATKMLPISLKLLPRLRSMRL